MKKMCVFLSALFVITSYLKAMHPTLGKRPLSEQIKESPKKNKTFELTLIDLMKSLPDVFEDELVSIANLGGAIKILQHLRLTCPTANKLSTSFVEHMVNKIIQSDHNNPQRPNTKKLLFWGAENGFPVIIKSLSTFNLKCWDWDNALIKAVEKNRGLTVKALLETNKTSPFSQLQYLNDAVRKSYTKSVEALIESKNISDYNCHQALKISLKGGIVESVKVLIKSTRIVEKNFTSPDIGCMRLLMWPALYGYHEIVKILLDSPKLTNSAINAMAHDHKTALMYAAENGHTKVVKTLLKDPRVDINKKTTNDTALSLAIEGGHTKTVKAFFACERLDIMEAMTFWEEISPELYNGIIEKAIKRNLLNDIIFHAIENNNKKVISALLSSDLVTPQMMNTARKKGEPPLTYCLRTHALDIARLLIASPKVNQNIIDDNGRTALITAIYLTMLPGIKKFVKLFLSSDSTDLNQTDKDGYTPLMYAVYTNQYDLVEKLLRSGANFNKKNKKNETALDLARKIPDHDNSILTLLERYAYLSDNTGGWNG